MNAWSITAAGERQWRTLGLRLAVVLTMVALHYAGYIICLTNKAFSGPWFPFQWNPSPEYETWRVLVGILEFPLVTVSHGLGLSETLYAATAVILNSFLWALVMYFAFSRLLAVVRRRT